MRVLPVLLAATLMASPAFAEKPTPDVETIEIAVENDTYRFGDLYRSQRATSVEACALVCRQESVCASWTLTPATFRKGPRCELKRTPGAASHRPGAVSGISEAWQMDVNRDGEMRYQPQVPASRQPAAVPLDQVRLSPVPRTFGEPLPKTEPELLGGPAPRVSAVVRRPAQPVVQTRVQPPAPAPAAAPVVELARGPGSGQVPEYVKQPAPTEPHPLYKEPIRTAAPAPMPAAPVTTFKDPARTAAAPKASTRGYNAVVKRQVSASASTNANASVPPQAPTPISATQAAAQVPALPSAHANLPATSVARAPAQIPPLPPKQPMATRVPWTERDGNTPNYSVGNGFIPGDDDATAGYIDGAAQGVPAS